MAQEFSLSFNPHNKIHATVVIRGLSIYLTLDLFSRVTTLPLGIAWRKEDKGDNEVAKRKFFLEGEELTEDKKWSKEGKFAIPIE